MLPSALRVAAPGHLRSDLLGGRISLREALGMPESVRTATRDRSTLGSRALSRTLNLPDALGRLTLSPLTRVGKPRIASLREMPAAERRVERGFGLRGTSPSA